MNVDPGKDGEHTVGTIDAFISIRQTIYFQVLLDAPIELGR